MLKGESFAHDLIAQATRDALPEAITWRMGEGFIASASSWPASWGAANRP